MKDFKFYCGIFATLFVATTATLLTSCSQEDDDYDTDMYTLAERMGTRANPGENSSSDGDDLDGYNSTDCAIWCLVQLKGGGFSALGDVWKIILENDMNTSEGLQQSDLIQISNSLGLGLQGFMNDTYGIIDQTTGEVKTVTESGRTVNKLLELTGGESGPLNKVIIYTPNHSCIGESVEVDNKRVKVKDVNNKKYVYFKDITGMAW